MEAKQYSLQTNGIKIPYYTCYVNQPKAVLVLIHGLKSHSGWFQDIVENLAKKNIKVYAFDRRGSGNSENERGHIDDYHLWLEDIYSMVQWAKKENSHLMVHLLGHCFGAKLALGFALRYPKNVQSLILVAPPQMSLKTDITLFEKIKVLANIVLKKKSYVAVPIQNDMFTRVPDKYRFIRKDQLKLEKMSTQFCLEVFKLDRLINKQFTDLSLPILVLLASEDRVVDNSKIQNKFFAKLKTSHKKLEIFDCMHDIFFEPLHEHVIEKIAEWTAL